MEAETGDDYSGKNKGIIVPLFILCKIMQKNVKEAINIVTVFGGLH
jgi:hypothetical protein